MLSLRFLSLARLARRAVSFYLSARRSVNSYLALLSRPNRVSPRTVVTVAGSHRLAVAYIAG